MDLKQLCEIHAPSGDEGRLRKVILEEVRALCGEENVRIDRMGNVLAFKKGTEEGHPHVCVSAHMDEVGFIIVGATEDGLLKFRCVGGIDPRVIVSKRVLVGEDLIPGVIGAMAIHLQSPADRQRVLDYNNLFIDIGAKDKGEALAKCPPATYAYFDTPYTPFGDGFVCAKALDDRVGCYNMLELMKESFPCDVTYAFVTQEEVGLRGATGAGYTVQPDVALVLEGTSANDMGDVDSRFQVCNAGKGVCISFMDGASIADRKLYQQTLKVAAESGAVHQVKRATTGGNDAGAYQRAAGGCKTCVLSVPCRYIHSGVSVAALSDIQSQYDVARAFLLNA